MNISVEAMMLSGAFGAVAMGASHRQPHRRAGRRRAQRAAGRGSSTRNLSHRIQINTFVVGLVLNALVLGLTSYLPVSWPGFGATRSPICGSRWLPTSR